MAVPEQVTLQRIVDLADLDLRSFLESEIRSSRLTPAEGRELLLEVLPGWVEPYENASATVAADLYEQKRFAAEVDRAVPYKTGLAPPADKARWGILASWATSFVAVEADWTAAFQKIVGGAHRTIADAHRNTTMRNATLDPASRGWKRVGSGSSTCEFCKMLIGRSTVYKEATVKFRSHDNCRCGAESEFHSVGSAEMKAFESSARKSAWSDERRKEELARVREWLL